MKTVFVSRHKGAAEWVSRNGFADVTVIPHFVPDGTPIRVIGTLPANIAAAVCAAGGEYHHLTIDIPADARGRELTADDMAAFGARLDRIVVLTAPEVLARCSHLANVAYHDGMAPFHDFGAAFGV